MTEEYKSFEQRMWDATKNVTEPVIDFVNYFSRTYYGTVVTPFRVPTGIRKVNEGQSFFQKVKPNDISKSSQIGVSFGIIAGAITDVGLPLSFINYCAKQEDYLSLALAGVAILATNTASGIFESVRTGKRGKDNLEQTVDKPEESKVE